MTIPRHHEAGRREDESPSSQVIQERYGQAYFSGATSGYPRTGYQASHPDWKAWLDFLALIKPSGVLVELGCAYGYLTGEARKRGYHSFGFDISSYALSQEPDLRSYLAQANVQYLPLPDRCADVLTLFDVLEHLDDPLQCLLESARVLRPEGLILGATPDPIFFNRKEETHCFERPPSFWLEAMRKLRLDVRFRFSVEAYNFQFLAAFQGSMTATKLDAFQHDIFEEQDDFLLVEDPLVAVPRFGWGPLTSGGRTLEKTPSSIYLLNPVDKPLRLRISFRLHHSSDFSRLRVLLDSHSLREIYLGSERLQHQVDLPEVVISSGGHHLFLDLVPLGPRVNLSDLRISVQPAEREDLTLALPFDLYQRYQLAADITGCLHPSSLIDVGGYLGDKGGHLASTQDFLDSAMQRDNADNSSIWFTDARHCDHPGYAPAPAWDQPFKDAFFDMVMSLDTLEHLPDDRREDFLSEIDRLARRWILLGAPFASAQVEAAECALAVSVMASQRFLQEHRELGLPQNLLVENFFGAKRGYRVYRFPNGYLPRWKEMQVLSQHLFRFRDYMVIQVFNRLYNQTFYRFDQAEPAYRTVFLISKAPLACEQESALKALHCADPQPARRCSDNAEFLELHERIARLLDERDKALTDVQFLANERQKLILSLQEENRELRDKLSTPLWDLAMERLRKRLG